MVDAVVKTYREGGEETSVLRGASLELRRGETTSLMGASGSGKSTLVGLVAGLTRADAGTVHFDGRDVGALDGSELALLRATSIGVVLQSGNLIPFLTARENVELALGLKRGTGERKGADVILAELGLADRVDHRPARLSGGEAQRVAIAMALANRPELLLADEITGELDSATAQQVMDRIFAASREHGLTVLYVTHDHELAARARNRLHLRGGRIVKS